MAAKKALIVWGGWDGHTPKQSADVFAPELEAEGFEVKVSDTMDTYKDADYMQSLDVVVPIWTMGQIDAEQEKGLIDAVLGGVGLAGFHGGVIDAFRNNTQYQFMTGGQWVAHPGGCIPTYKVVTKDKKHPITKGVAEFDLPNTEQYYVHVDPGNHVLCETTFTGEHCAWIDGVIMPVVWKRMWGKGRVFYTSLAHVAADVEVPEVQEIIRRGMLWASK